MTELLVALGRRWIQEAAELPDLINKPLTCRDGRI